MKPSRNIIPISFQYKLLESITFSKSLESSWTRQGSRWGCLFQNIESYGTGSYVEPVSFSGFNCEKKNARDKSFKTLRINASACVIMRCSLEAVKYLWKAISVVYTACIYTRAVFF